MNRPFPLTINDATSSTQTRFGLGPDDEPRFIIQFLADLKILEVAFHGDFFTAIGHTSCHGLGVAVSVNRG